MTINQQISPSSLRAYKATKYVNGNPQKMLLEAKKAKRVTSQFMTKGGAKAAAKRMKLLKRTVKDGKSLLDTLLKKVPGGTGTAKAGRLGSLFGILAGVAGAALVLKLNEAVQNAEELVSDMLSADISRVAGTVQLVKSKLDTTNKKVEELRLQDQRTRDRMFSLEKQIPDIKKSGNDALYEVRKGREILEVKIEESRKLGNDALYEARQGRQKLEAQVKEINLNFSDRIKELNTKFNDINSRITAYLGSVKDGTSQAISTTIANLKASLDIANKNTSDLKASVDTANKTITSQNATISKLSTDVNALNQKVNTSQPASIEGKILDIAKNLVGKQFEILSPKVVTLENSVAKLKIDTSVLATTDTTLANLITTAISSLKVVDGKIEDLKLRTSGGGTLSLNPAQIQQIQDKINAGDAPLKAALDKLTGDLNAVKVNPPEPASLGNIKAQISNIDARLRTQQKVNEQALPKLDEITAKLGLIPALTANTIRPDIPSAEQINNAVQQGNCRSLNGGCSGRAMNQQTGDIRDAINQANNDLLDKINTGANAAQLALLGTINTKLGDQLPGGLSATFGRLWKTLQVDRILSILTFITTMHNAAMLSNSIAQTLFGAFDNIAQAAGFKWENEKGEDVGFGGIISEWTTNFFKGIFGEETFNNLSATWKRANRIYQAAANIANSVRSMIDSVRSIGEFIAENTGRIGNALKRFGVVGDDAYRWMPEQVNGQSLWVQKLQNLEDAASGIEMVTGEVASIAQNVNEIKEQSDIFKKSLEDSPKKEQTENKAVKESEDSSKADSNSPLIPRESERKANS